jgi:hypothetical protein
MNPRMWWVLPGVAALMNMAFLPFPDTRLAPGSPLDLRSMAYKLPSMEWSGHQQIGSFPSLSQAPHRRNLMSQLSPILRLATGNHLTFWCPGCKQAHMITFGEGPGP